MFFASVAQNFQFSVIWFDENYFSAQKETSGIFALKMIMFFAIQ